eukprot:gene4225-8404_t
MSGGPQNQRDRIWTNRSAEILNTERQDLVRQDIAIDRSVEKQVYEGELSRLRRENTALKENVQRCLKELKAYQLKYPSPYSAAHPLMGDELPPWISSSDINSPLFDAYDARIAELEDVVNQQRLHLDKFREEATSLVTENTNLRNAQLETLRQSAVQHKRDEGGGGSGTFGPLEAELLNELNERAEILMAENAIMVEQKTTLVTELENYQAELQRSNQDVSHLNQQLAQLSKELQHTRGRMAQAERDREEAASHTQRYSEALGKVEAELDECKDQLSVWQQKGEVADSNMTEARKQLKAMLAKMEEDSFGYMRRTKGAEDRVKELHVQLLLRTKELDESNEVARKLRREYQSTRQDAEGMLQVMSGLERQLGEFAAREEDVQRVGKESKERLEEALAISREEQCRREMDRLLDERKRLMLQRQKEMDDMAEQAKTSVMGQVKNVEANLLEAERRNAVLRAETDKAVRDTRGYKEQLERLHRELEAQRDATAVAMKDLEDRLVTVAVNHEEEVGRVKKIKDTNQELRATIDKLRSQMETTRAQTDERDKMKDKEISLLKTAMRESQKDFEDRFRILVRQCKEADEQKTDAENSAMEAERRRDEDNVMLRRRVSELEALLKELQATSENEEKRLARQIRAIQETCFASNAAMEARMKDERETTNKITSRCRHLEEAIADGLAEKESLSRSAETDRAKIGKLKEQLNTARFRISELTSRLATSFEAREESVKAAARAIESAHDEQDYPRFNASGSMSSKLRYRGSSPESVMTRESGDGDVAAEDTGRTSFDQGQYQYSSREGSMRSFVAERDAGADKDIEDTTGASSDSESVADSDGSF